MLQEADQGRGVEVDEGSMDASLLDGLGEQGRDEAKEVVGFVLGEGSDEVVSSERKMSRLRSYEEGGEVRVFAGRRRGGSVSFNLGPRAATSEVPFRGG